MEYRNLIPFPKQQHSITRFNHRHSQCDREVHWKLDLLVTVLDSAKIKESTQDRYPMSQTISRQELLSVIQNTPEADIPQLLQLIQNFQQNNSLDPALALQKVDLAQFRWQQAVAEIDRQDKTNIEQKKANIDRLIAALNEDDDIEEQQQTLATLNSRSGISI